MGRTEFINLAGLRVDGRRPREVRRMRARLGVLPHADGSAYFQMGLCKVLCAVFGPRGAVRRSDMFHDRALVTCTHSAAPFSSTEHREKRKGTDRHSVEIQTAVQKCFEDVILTKLHPRSQIDIQLHVLQSDGGQLCACINAATIALCDAGIPMKDMLVACSVGLLESQEVVDLNYLEESGGGGVVLPVAMLPRSEKISAVKLTSKVELSKLEGLLKAALAGCREVYEVLQAVVQERALSLLSARGAIE